MRLSTDIPTCRWCPAPAVHWRREGNPPWGVVGENWEPLGEKQAYALWEETERPDDVYGTCDLHFHSKEGEDGQLTLTTLGQHLQNRKRQGGTANLTRGDMLSLRKSRLRGEILRRLGGECEVCGFSTPDLLRICWAAGAHRPVREGTAGWYRWLLEEPARLGSCKLLCCSCTLPKPEPTSARAQVISHYGAACPCGEAELVWIVPAVGVSVPKYPNGKKYGSHDKIRWLIRNGFPEGWLVRCPAHAGDGSYPLVLPTPTPDAGEAV